jgi:hypothetical protein
MNLTLIVTKLKQVIQEVVHICTEEIKKRSRKLTFTDIIYCSCLMIGNNLSYATANAHLKIQKIVDTSTRSLVQYKNNIHNKFFNKINNDLLSFIYEKCERRILAVDGTYISLLKLLFNEGFSLSKSGNYCTALISTIFDVEREIPINYRLSTGKNERKTLIEQLKYIKSGDILIMDRGYYSHELLYRLNNLGIKVIFRLTTNLKNVSKMGNKNDVLGNIEYAETKIKFRIIKYTINNKKYYLGTTIFNENIEYFKNLYWKRWKVEINFRHSKYNLKMNNIISESKNGVLQDINIHNFLFIISSYLQYCLRENIDNSHKISTKTHLHLVTNYIIRLLLYKKCTDNNINEIIRILNISKNTLVPIQQNRSYERVRIKPSTKWNELGNRYG